MGKSLNWNPSSWCLAQVNHVLAGALVLMVFAAHPWLALVLFTLIVGLKEFWADLTWLEHDSWAGSCIDFGAYMAGALGGLVAPLWLPGAFVLVGGSILALTIWDIMSPNTEPQ